MDVLTKKVGKILYAIPFIVFGLFHFMKAGDMAFLVPGWVPGGAFWVYLTGLALIAAGVAIIAGKQAKNASLGLALLLLIFIVTVHLPGLGNPQMMQMAMMALLKDLALMGAALTYAGILDN